jgi:MarR family transcriptional regulator, 2-MHQ and catechol-resistance regulon repressor
MTVESQIKVRRFASPTDRAVVSMLVASGHVYARLGEICDRHGITTDQYNVLRIRILRGVHPEGHPRREIIQRLISRSPDVTRLLDRLERQKLVERLRSAEDRRLSISRITAKGLKVLAAIDPELTAMHRELTARLTAKDLEELARLCNLLLP